jgi:SAM-dependent methyltransferase
MDLPGEYKLVKCNQCGLLYLDPQPTWEVLNLHYPADYHCYSSAPDKQTSAIIRWAQQYGLRRRRRIITQIISNGVLLDVGCATGLFLNEMSQSGHWQVKGVEPVATAAEFARDHFGLDIFQGNLIDANFASESYDVITLWDVLEHTPEPNAVLVEIFRILKPQGLLVVKLPDPESREAKIFGSAWVGYEAPQHLFGFPELVLTTKLKSIGFQQVKVDALGGDFLAFMVSLQTWLQDHKHSKSSGFIKSLARSPLARFILSPLFIIIRQLGLRSSKVYLVRKP